MLAAQLIASSGRDHANPAGVVLVLFAVAVPGELDFDAAVAVSLELLLVWADHVCQLRTIGDGFVGARQRPDGLLERMGGETAVELYMRRAVVERFAGEGAVFDQ